MAKTKMHQGTGNRSREEGPAPILYDIQNRIKNVPLKSLLGSIYTGDWLTYCDYECVDNCDSFLWSEQEL